ncbi:hypothetical protein BJ138DRAFT_1143707 [Hygrophoropsis aurantiaca]|uniref:Uncharacterized protein n=1 Tax=Hygrophoropsis aurantiaca TaxID=72124 RepID=A0ACB8AMQ7_9AGAM|nr:hypothetical protein BJ138DRAFT_1143707 [Hygrophoropsis aurantiaca]
MFAKLSALALVLPLVSAITLNAPTGLTTGGEATVTWTTASGDSPYFTLELVNTIFNNEFAISNNVQTSLGTLTFEMPQVPPGDGYTLEAINTANVNDVYSTSGDFAIGAASTASTTSASSASGMTMSSGAVMSTGTTPATTSSASAAPSTYGNTGAASSLSSFSVGPAAALLISAVAGAVVIF